MRCKWEISEKLKDEIFIYFLVGCVYLVENRCRTQRIPGEKTTKNIVWIKLKKKLKKKKRKKK